MNISKIKALRKFAGGVTHLFGYYKKGGSALGLSPRLPKGGQRHRLIGGDSYGK